MIRCENIVHPFQTDTGTSQRQRVIDDLLGGTATIDGRKMADLLHYVSQLSPHINFYDRNLEISDWQPFFSKSLPFILTRISKYDKGSAERKFKNYTRLFNKRPSRQSLQLLVHFIYNNTINPVNKWQLQLKGSDLPAERILEKVIRDKLKEPVQKFICLSNDAVQRFKMKRIDFTKLQKNETWGFSASDIISNSCFSSSEPSRRKRLLALGKEISNLFAGLLNAMDLVVSGSELSLEQSILPLKDEFRQNHSPHLALLFAFLKLFSKFQNDLNGFTKKHLDFFYKDVLKFVPASASPDKVHLLFEIQNQLETYLVKKSVKAKGGKDKNKKEIQFATEDEIVVNKAVVAEAKTLFLNNRSVNNTRFLEGMYIAPNARMADGIENSFKEGMPSNWPTLGSKFSKHTDPLSKTIVPYPAARVGFILASPVLLLNEGTRNVDLQIACKIDETLCDLKEGNDSSNTGCCDSGDNKVMDPEEKKKQKNVAEKERLCGPEASRWILPGELIDPVNWVLSRSWHFLTLKAIDESIKKGISQEIAKKIRNRFLIDECFTNLCCKKEKRYLSEHFVSSKAWNKFLISQVVEPTAIKLLNELFPGRKAFKIHFSGEKEWIEPSEVKEISLFPSADRTGFALNFKLRLDSKSPAVSFFNKDNLKEDLNTTLPLVKVELDNDLGIVLNQQLRKKLNLQGGEKNCCLENPEKNCREKISLYHFFRYARILNEVEIVGTLLQTGIDVSVCGLKKFLVKNTESIQNSNGPVYLFGTNPEIIDFDPTDQVLPPIVTNKNLIGPSFYLGSAEVLYKKWNSVYINIDWKDKPTNFRDYYKGYFNDGAGNFGLNEDRFLVNLAVLQNSQWKGELDRVASGVNQRVSIKSIEYFDRHLFRDDGKAGFCEGAALPFPQTIRLDKEFFDLQREFLITKESVSTFGFDSLNGFLKINLQVQDFRHRMYSYVLARQMMALGKLPETLEDAVYYDATLPPPHLIVFSADDIKTEVENAKNLSATVRVAINENAGGGNPGGIGDNAGDLFPLPTDRPINSPQSFRIREILYPPDVLFNPNGEDLTGTVVTLDDELNGIKNKLNGLDTFQAVIPNTPWTPIANALSLDYTATALINDIDLIHLYPFEGTHKIEEISLKPALFPTYCDEGNLFLGIDKLTPGSNLNILFQLAEATADSESLREDLSWYYLDNNTWRSLRKGFEVLNDASDQLTSSGIVKLALPGNMNKENTVLPDKFHWIKVSVRGNSKSIAETINIHTQAILATFSKEEGNDELRLSQAFPAGSISKLTEADPQVKTLLQPYDSFGGREPEEEGHFYQRVSELLRHKGRAIQKWDYERLILENFPQIYKAKCINHSYALDAKKYSMDFPIAPGYVVLAVIPDLMKLKAGNSFEPKAPVSLLEQIEKTLRSRTSPFVRLRVMNPRYEKVDICIKVKLHKGRDEVYYKQKLEDDIRAFLAPWSVGEFSKLGFGQCINRSDMIRFFEELEYLDYVLDLKMKHEQKEEFYSFLQETCPITPRSILLAGSIEVCIRRDDCEEWGKCYDDDSNRISASCCDEKPEPIHDFCGRTVIIR